MPLNLGYIELTANGVIVRIYYDATFSPVGDDQPLINGPRGWCLDVTNPTGRAARIRIAGLRDTPFTATIGAGDPVLSGAGRSRTTVQLATAGFTTRGDCGELQIG